MDDGAIQAICDRPITTEFLDLTFKGASTASSHKELRKRRETPSHEKGLKWWGEEGTV